jgi:two-component system chemotaxis response regulator CheY
VSTEAALNDQVLAYKAGANGYLIKPIKPVQLLTHTQLLLGEIY